MCGVGGPAVVRVGPSRRVDLSGRAATGTVAAARCRVGAGPVQHPRPRRVRAGPAAGVLETHGGDRSRARSPRRRLRVGGVADASRRSGVPRHPPSEGPLAHAEPAGGPLAVRGGDGRAGRRTGARRRWCAGAIHRGGRPRSRRSPGCSSTRTPACAPTRPVSANPTSSSTSPPSQPDGSPSTRSERPPPGSCAQTSSCAWSRRRRRRAGSRPAGRPPPTAPSKTTPSTCLDRLAARPGCAGRPRHDRRRARRRRSPRRRPASRRVLVVRTPVRRSGGTGPRRPRQDGDGARRRPGRRRRRPPRGRRGHHRQGRRRTRRHRPVGVHDRPTPPRSHPPAVGGGAVVILDEISQTSTRDLHTVLAAVAACPGGQLWVLGDPRQSPSVKAGGIATELEHRVTAGAIAAATLTVNRRQLDPTDRHALALLRAGQPAESQRLRTVHGWEHEASTPGRTRAAMADAVTADIIEHGAGVHRRAGRIPRPGRRSRRPDPPPPRRRRADPPVPSSTGPGWTSERSYQAGDRILFHTRLRRPPLAGWSTAPSPPSPPSTTTASSSARWRRPRPPPGRVRPGRPGRRVTERVPRLGPHRRRRPRRHLGPRPPVGHHRPRRLPRLHRPIPLPAPHPHLEHHRPRRPATTADGSPTGAPAPNRWPPPSPASPTPPWPPATTPGRSTATYER